MPDFFKVDPTDVLAALTALSQKDAPFITAYALTKTAQDIVADERASMAQVFDRPTTFTLNSLAIKPATKTDLNAIVFFKSDAGSIPAWKYLAPEVEGGSRSHKSFELRLIRAGLMKSDEFSVPGSAAKLDASGNMPGSLIEQILSQVQAAEQFAGYSANATTRSLKKKKAVGRYFLLRPDAIGAKAARSVKPGIYYRAGTRDIEPVLLFVTSPNYSKRFPFHETAADTFNRQLLLRAREGFQRYVVDKANS